jgi:hypothetical protein
MGEGREESGGGNIFPALPLRSSLHLMCPDTVATRVTFAPETRGFHSSTTQLNLSSVCQMSQREGETVSVYEEAPGFRLGPRVNEATHQPNESHTKGSRQAQQWTSVT